MRLMGFGVHYAPRFVIKQAIAALPAPDQAMLTQPEFQQGFIAMVREALRGGSRGAQWDTALMVSRWDFRPQNIRVEVDLWHGEADTGVEILAYLIIWEWSNVTGLLSIQGFSARSEPVQLTYQRIELPSSKLLDQFALNSIPISADASEQFATLFCDFCSLYVARSCIRRDDPPIPNHWSECAVESCAFQLQFLGHPH